MSGGNAGRWLAIAASAVVVATVIAAMLAIGSPSAQRDSRMDRKREQDLNAIAMAIDGHVSDGEPLPADLSVLAKEPGVSLEINDPQSRAPYTYQVTGERTYKLCAVFSTDTAKDGGNPYGNQEWPHGVGQKCFDRKVDKRDS